MGLTLYDDVIIIWHTGRLLENKWTAIFTENKWEFVMAGMNKN